MLARVGGELRTDILPLVARSAALDGGENVAVTALAEDISDPLEGGGVLGEDDDSLVDPAPVGSADRVEEGDQRLQPRVGPMLEAAPPADEFCDLLARRRDERVRALASA